MENENKKNLYIFYYEIVCSLSFSDRKTSDYYISVFLYICYNNIYMLSFVGLNVAMDSDVVVVRDRQLEIKIQNIFVSLLRQLNSFCVCVCVTYG